MSVKKLVYSALRGVTLDRGLEGEDASSVLQNNFQILSMLETIRNVSFLQSLRDVSLGDQWDYMFCQRYRN